MKIDLAQYRKLIVAVIGAVSVALSSDAVLDLNDFVNVMIAALTALGVYVAPNTQPEE